MVALPKPRPAAESDIDLFEKDVRSEMRRLVSENMSLGDPESFDFAMPKGYTKESTGSALIGDTNIPDPMSNIPLMISDDPDIIRADRRRQAKEFGEGLALGVTTDLLGLPADILALVFRDAPQLAAALTKSVTTGTPVAEEIAAMNANPSLLDQALTAVQKYAGGDALAGYLGYSPEQLQRSGVLAGRIGAAAFDPFVLLGAGSRAKQVLQGEILPPEQGPSRQGIPTQGPIIEGDINQEGIGTLLPAPRTPDLVSDTPQVGFTGEVELPEGQPTRLQSTGDITDVPTRSVAGITEGGEPVDEFLDFTRPDADPNLGDENLMQFEGDMIHVPTGIRVPAGSNVIGNIADFDTPAGRAATLANRTEFTQRMATPEETASFIENRGIAGLPAADDAADVDSVVQTALTPIRTEGQQILRDEAFPITEDITSLPDAPAQPLPQQGEIIDYTPVYRQLQSLDPNQAYTPKGLATLLRALPERADRDLKNLGAVDDPMVVELTEDTYNKYLRAKNDNKPFSQFKTERDASQRPAPPFIKLKENTAENAPPGELIFDSEVKVPQKIPDSGLLRILDGMTDAGQGDAPITKNFIVQLFEKSQPQVAVRSVQQSDAANRNYLLNAEQRAELSSSDEGKMLEQVERLANEQNTFADSALNDPTVMIFNNPTTGSFLGTPLKGVPAHDYWSDTVPGYYGHIRYTDLGEIDPVTDQSTGSVFAGLIENQSNLQNAYRGAGKDFDAIEDKDIILPSPELMYFLKGVEDNISKDIVGINKAMDDVKQAEEAASRSDLLSDMRKEIEKEKSMVYYDGRFVYDILDQDPSDYSGTTGSRVANVSDAANKLLELKRNKGLEGDFDEDELIAALSTQGETELIKILEDGLDNLENTNDFRNAEIHARASTHHAKIRDGLGKDNSFGRAAFFLARHKSKRSAPILFPETILDGFKIPDRTSEFDSLGSRLTRAPREDLGGSPDGYKVNYTANEIIVKLAKRPDIDEDLLIQLFNREGPFDRRFGLPSYGGLSAQFGSDEAADAIVLGLQRLMDDRNVLTANQKILIEDVLSQPAAMQEVADLGGGLTAQEFIRIFAENATLGDMKDFANEYIGGPFNPFDINKPELDKAGAVAEFMKLAEEDSKRIGQIAPGFLNIDFGEVMNMAQYGRARQTRNQARAALYNKLTTEFPGEVDTTRPISPRNISPDSDLYDQNEFLQNVFEVEKEVQELIDSGKVLPTSEFDDSTLAEIVKSYATNQRRGFKIATPTPYSNAAQQQQHMYRAFIQEAVKKGYDGVVFPSPTMQAAAHGLNRTPSEKKVAKQIYGKSLANAMKQINEEHPEFPTFEQAMSDFKYQTQGAGSTTDNAVVIRFTPEIKAIFEDRVIRRAKGGEVDLRPRKMIHSGIGAMAKEVM